ncbi:MAG: EAL domain-containing protein [Campylobacterota bacterium]|nr:EAL domain-containing protein [Campylobacterota bacterium]
MNDLKTIVEYAQDIRVLYVEDEDDARAELTNVLNIFFNKVFIAKNGQEALEVFEKESIEFVISDITMPVMDGIEMMKVMRQSNKKFKSIFITAHSKKETILESIKLNVDGYILKPIEQTQLMDVLSKIIYTLHVEKEKVDFDKKLKDELKKQKELILKQSQSLIEMLQRDSLTQLYNFERLKIDYAKIAKKPTLILFNIDNFNFINLTHGFATGDLVIKDFGNFLLKFCTKEIYLYKLYGDEFMMIYDSDNILDILSLCEDIQRKLYTNYFTVDGDEFNISASMGIVEPVEADIALPYHKSKLALQEGRHNHKNSITIYKENMSLIEKQTELLKWSKKSKSAIDEKRLKAYFQPIYEFEKRAITKYESLVRIVDGSDVISPFYFLESMRTSGLLPALSRAMIEQTCKYFQEYPEVSFSINITDEDFKDGELLGMLLYYTNKYSIEPSRVTIEILENINDYDASDANNKLLELKEEGFIIALDDFGAQNSNFSRIQNLNIDIIKIDGAFIKNIDNDLNSKHIVETIVYYAKKANVKTIAEFVQSKEIFEIVESLGIDYAQGYYIGKPEENIIN